MSSVADEVIESLTTVERALFPVYEAKTFSFFKGMVGGQVGPI